MEDLISQLPDELLQVILLNVSTRDSVRTSVLSTRWRNLWKGVPGLHLIGGMFSNIDVKEFLDRFLNLHKESSIYQFTLMCNDNKDYKDVDGFSLKWLIDKVITLAIDGSYTTYRVINVPVSLYKCETLVYLWLEFVKLNDCEFINLPRLKTMHLEHVLLYNEVVLEELILCSPVLQVLNIHNTIITLGHLTLRSQTVKRLSLRRCSSSSSSDGGFVIDIPSLEILSIKDDLLDNFRVESVSSSIKICLDVSVGAKHNNLSRMQAFHNFFVGFISGVTDLTISANTLAGLYPDCPPQQLPHFENLTHLNACFHSGFSEMLPMLLMSCPNLKSLDLWLYGYPKMKIIASSPVLRCFLTSIKYIDVKMTPGAGQMRSGRAEIKFARYILENAAILKKLTLWLAGNEDESRSVLQRFLTFPNRKRSFVEVKMNQRPAKFQPGYGFEFKPVFDPTALFYLYRRFL